MEKETLVPSMQELGPRYYREQVLAAQAILQGGDAVGTIGTTFTEDERLVRARQELCDQKMRESARYAVGLVGRVSIDGLRKMVEPKSLREVLLLGGAGLEVLMQVGEGRAELEEVLATYEERTRSLRARAAVFEKDSVKKFALDRALGRIDAALKNVQVFNKPLWDEKEALRFLGAQQAFASTCEAFEVDLVRWEGEVAKSVSESPVAGLSQARQVAEAAFARRSSLNSSGS